jgi:hypothetical protein
MKWKEMRCATAIIRRFQSSMAYIGHSKMIRTMLNQTIHYTYYSYYSYSIDSVTPTPDM